MASSSSSYRSAPASSSRSYKYDVFLSFRGEDTRRTFVDHLVSKLKEHEIEVYKDDQKLQLGDPINQALFKAIDESQIALIILSENYADSSWCLEELAYIMRCKETNGLIVIPIFYKVEPTDVRNQKRKFGKAFGKQRRKNVTKIDIWKKALREVVELAGLEPKQIADGHEAQFIKKIVDEILERLYASKSWVDDDLVGMEARVQYFKSLLDNHSKDVCMIGIWGVGGSGKTTLANSVYMEMSQHFQGCCIVENLREESNKCNLEKLQENILSALLKSQVKVHSVREGKNMMKEMLCRRKVLIVLDDVDKREQLDALAGKHDWFGSESIIIITTRDEHLLKAHKVNHVHQIELLSDDEAIKLFRRYAYNEKDPLEDYETLSLRAVSYASGLPLSLKVLGSFLCDKNTKEWMSALEKFKDFPNEEVMDILEISYDALEPDQKEIFLDIACFWVGHESALAKETLEACGFHYDIGIKVLTQKALITFDGRCFGMPAVIQEMGQYIARGKHPGNLEKYSRIWNHEEIEEMCLRDSRMENHTIEAIKTHAYDEFDESDHALPICSFISNLKKLKRLSMYIDPGDEDDEIEGSISLSNELRYMRLENYGVTSPFMMSSLRMKLVVLKLEGTKQKELWKGCQDLPHLKVLELKRMEKLFRTPDFNGLPCLQRLILDQCRELEEIQPSLENCTSLEYLKVNACSKVKNLPKFSHMKNMKELHITSMGDPRIESCSLRDGDMSCGICELWKLEVLNLSRNASITRLNFNLSQLTHLKFLNVSKCPRLLELPKLPSSLAILSTLDCHSLTLVEDFYENCKELCEVSLAFRGGWSAERLLQLMLEGKAAENECMYLHLDGGLDIAKGFTPPLLRTNRYRLELPDNWRIDFTGFLMCIVLPPHMTPSSLFMSSVLLSMDQDRGMNDKQREVWEESVGEKNTVVWYVSFVSLSQKDVIAWWDQTFNAITFSTRFRSSDADGGVAVKLVNRGLTETSTHSPSRYMPKLIKWPHKAPEPEVAIELNPFSTS